MGSRNNKSPKASSRKSLNNTGSVNSSGITQAMLNDVVSKPVDPNDIQAQSTSNVISNFSALSEDEQAQAIINGISQDVPDFLSDSDFQKFMYSNGIDGTPQIVNDSALDSIGGIEIYRTVNSVYDRYNDVGYTGLEIAQQLQYGDFTRFSDTGGSAYGRGLYFSNDYSGSSSYGNVHNNVNKTAMVRAKLNSNAKIMDYSSARRGVSNEVAKGTTLGKALNKINDSRSAVSIYALAKGYNVLVSDTNFGRDTYVNVLDRSALTMSDTVKAINRNGSW